MLQIPIIRHLAPRMIRNLIIKQTPPMPFNLLSPKLRRLFIQLLVHPAHMPPRPSRPEKRIWRQRTHLLRILLRQLLRQQHGMIVPLAAKVDVLVCLEPPRNERAVRARRHYGVAETPTISAFGAEDDVVRRTGFEEAVEGAEGEGVDVEVDSAFFVEELEAHYVGEVGVVCAEFAGGVVYEFDVGFEALDPWVCEGIGVRGGGGRFGEVGVVEVDGLGIEGDDGATDSEVGEEVEAPGGGAVVGVLEAENEVYDVGDRIAVLVVGLRLAGEVVAAEAGKLRLGRLEGLFYVFLA